MRVLVVMDPIENVNLKKTQPWQCYGLRAAVDMIWAMLYNKIYILIR
jgi:hypothetical protein